MQKEQNNTSGDALQHAKPKLTVDEQIVSLLFLHHELIEDASRSTRATEQLDALTKSFKATRERLSSNDTITSSFDFLTKVAQGWFEVV